MNAGDKVWIHNKSRMDYAFQDRIGTFVETTSNGYARVHLDGDSPTMRVLVHPESIEVLHLVTAPADQWDAVMCLRFGRS